jgi:hypothetical protein
VALPSRRWVHIQFGQKAMAAFGFADKQLAMLFVSEGPADGLAVLLRDEHGAMFFGAAMLQFPPMLDGEVGVAAAVGLERRLVILQAVDEGQDRRFVLRQLCVPNTNGRAP